MAIYKIETWMLEENHGILNCVAVLVFLVFFAISGTCFAGTHFKCAVIVSKKIRPYLDVMEGISAGLANKSVEVDEFFLSPRDNQFNDQLIGQVRDGRYDLVTVLGPESAVLVWTSQISAKKFYVAVLDPGALPELAAGTCGISLRIPVDVQVKKIAQIFQTLKKIGLLFDPLHNQWFFDQALLASAKHGIDIIPLSVDSKNQISGVLKEYKGEIDAIWMIPDQTVISQKIIHYVIKQGLYNGMGVIGYNSFFTRSGAFFSFEFDYESLGKQAVEAIMTYLETGECQENTPVFNSIINQKMVDKIGIRVAK